MTTHEILDVLYGCYENHMPVSYKSLVNTLKLHDIPFTHHVYEITEDVRTTSGYYTFRTKRSCAVDISIELYGEGSRIAITMVNDYITHMNIEFSMANMFMNSSSLTDLDLNNF